MIKRKPVPLKPEALPNARQMMPGSFDVQEDILTLIDSEIQDIQWNPVRDIFESNSTMARAEDVITSSGVDIAPKSESEELDWRRYDPPAALRKAPNITSHVLLEIIQSSVDKVRRSTSDELREEDAKTQQALEAELASAREQKQRVNEPYLPIIVVEDTTILRPSSSGEGSNQDGPLPRQSSGASQLPCSDTKIEDPISSPDSPTEVRSAPGLIILPGSERVHKSRESAIRRLFKRSTDKGESSADGSARESLLQRLMDTKGDNDLTTTEQKTDFAVAKLKRRLRSAQTPEPLRECVSCLEDIPGRDCVRVQCHDYCHDCFVRLVTTACENEAQWPPKCCLNNIPFALIRKTVPSNLKKTFNERSAEWEIPVGERVYCWRTDCSLFIQPKKVRSNTSVGLCNKGHATCLNCRNQSHGQDDCPMDQAMILTNQMAEEEGWRRCYRCRALVEHSEACQHMTCRCGAEFCYVCGLQWRTCQCNMQDLDDVKNRAQERREARRLREEVADADAAELRSILRQIEEFEREEARKAEELAEQQRQEKRMRRERELLERAKAESARIRDIGLKFSQLREDLDGLHDLQLVLVEMDREEATASLIREGEEATALLMERHEAKRAELVTNIAAKWAAREHALAKDRKSRIAVEVKIESQFREQLCDFWQGNENAATEIEVAMLQLQRRLDRKFRAWQKWKMDTMQELHDSLEEELTVQEELMWSAEQRLRTQHKTDLDDMQKRGLADKQWIEAVMLEREKMVNELEAEEMESDADILHDSDAESEAEWEDAPERQL
ncbi:IBR domain, a half RING-finger domain-containing protein [Sarocladium implicatum]|nr:IBR domain, a half RING-finger domain-containing protein [Sarocladium implicatum]